MNDENSSDGEGRATADDRFMGVMLAASSSSSILFMAHHPTSIDAVRATNIVHGALMGLVVLTAAGFGRFAAISGGGRWPVATGMAFYAAGAGGNLLAATINGFAAPAATAAGVASADVGRFAWELNQASAFAAVYATSAAFCLWGGDLVRHARPMLGLAGLAAGLFPVAPLASGVVDMHVEGAFAVYAVQAIFGAIIGIRMAMGRL